MATMPLRRAQQIANRITTEAAFEIERQDDEYGYRRRARKMKTITPSTTTTIDGEPLRRIDTLRANLLSRTEQMIRLTEIGSRIRQTMALKQADCGVSALVTERVGLVKMQTILEYLLESVEQNGSLDIPEVRARVESMRNRLTNATQGAVTAEFTTGLLTAEDQKELQNRLTTVKRRLLDIDDRLAQLNATNTVDINDADEDYLKNLSIA